MLAGRRAGLYAELAEVVVEVFLHQDGPLLGGEGTEEGVGVGGAGVWAGGGESVDGQVEALLLRGEVAGVGDDE